MRLTSGDVPIADIDVAKAQCKAYVVACLATAQKKVSA